MPPRQSNSNRWYPSENQLKDPAALRAAFKQLLDQFYTLQDQLNNAAQSSVAAPKPSGPPPGSGPSDTMLLGLRVAPVDVQTLADGVQLTYVKASGNFQLI